MTTDIDLKGFVQSHPRRMPLMPLLHCCEGSDALKIIREQKITPETCDVYHEDINYFFYGKSRYVPNIDEPPMKLWDYYPVIFIYKPTANYNIRRVVALDSGALEGELFSDYLHSKIKKEDLEVGDSVDVASRTVRAFFGKNADYLKERGKEVAPPNAPIIAMNLSNLYRTGAKAKFDGRNACIEVQIVDEIGCHAGLLEHIVLPEVYSELDFVMNRVDVDWAITRTFYRCTRFDPKVLAGLAADKAADYVEARYA